MNLAKLSIKNPAFIISIMLATIIVGIASFKSMGVDQFPDINIPIVSVTTVYKGAGAAEIETLVSRPIEEQIAAISGLKHLTSKSLEGVSQVVAEFKTGADIKFVEQEVRDKVNLARGNLPREIEEPLIRRFDPSDQPIMTLAVSADLPAAGLYDLADETIKKRLEQVNNVGAIEIYGGRKREVRVLLDRRKLAIKDMSVSQVSAQIGASGENIPSGKVNLGDKELNFRGLGEFESVPQISDILVNLYGNEVPTRVGELGKVEDSLEDEKSRTFLEGKNSLFLYVYRQSGTNTVDVVNGIKAQIAKLNQDFKEKKLNASIVPVIDTSIKILDNVDDVYTTISIAIALTILTVFLFLGDVKTTLITAASLPVSLIGSFIAMKVSGFSINIVTLLALTLSVGLLVDDAIVVIENIYRRIGLGEKPRVAAEKGTGEIQLSVFAITLVVISVFVPVAFMSGVVGQFLRQFGLSIAFSMIVSFIVSITLIPLLSANFLSGGHKTVDHRSIWDRTFGLALGGLERAYGRILGGILKYPIVAIVGVLAVFAFSIVILQKVPQSFKPDEEAGEVLVDYELPPGESLDGTQAVGEKIEKIVRTNRNVKLVTLTVGGRNGEANKAELFIRLKRGKESEGTTGQFRNKLRGQLKDFADYQLVIKEFDPSGGVGGQPIQLNLRGQDQAELASNATTLISFLKADSRVKDVDSNYRPGKPEFRIKLSPSAANTYGINSKTMGTELRGQVEGFTPAKFRENGREYDVRVRLQQDQRNLKESFSQVLVPNVNHKLIRLSDIAQTEEAPALAEINRQDRARYIQITAGLSPGVGLSDVINDLVKHMTTGEEKLPPSMSFSWSGDVENMAETGQSAAVAIGFAVVFIYFILSSLYGSFVTPLTILVALPLALSGAFFALYLAHESMGIFVILGIFLLLGVAGKNSILLVDFANQMMAQGKGRSEAILAAGVARLRPILMTSFALISGTIPVAIGLSEASKQRTSMGWTVIGGVISSTLLTLIVVPAIFSYMDRYRVWSKALLTRIFIPRQEVSNKIEIVEAPERAREIEQ